MSTYQKKYAAMTFEEIAQRLGVTRPAVRTTYERAISKIRRNLEAMEQLRAAMAQHERAKPQGRVYPDWQIYGE